MSLLVLARPALAIKPDSPEVKKLIDKGLKYLETASDARLGGKCLIGLTMYKAGKPVDHPQIVAAIEACQKEVATKPPPAPEDIYNLGVALIFLCEVDPSRYSTEIKYFLDLLLDRQKDHGGWGYPDKTTGDTSMTQYGVLGLWTAKQAGHPVSEEQVEKAANWLLRTQDTSGGWGYQGNDPGTFEKAPQSDVRLSLTTAALGSVLISANLMGMIEWVDEGEEEPLPPSLRLVDRRDPAKAKVVDPQRLRSAMTSGTSWFHKNFAISTPSFTHYYMYALERFMSFKDLAENKRPEDPSWYNDGVAFLAKTQNPTGGWSSNGGEPVDTSFAVLFLLRSTKKSIEKSLTFGDGTLTGGRGLPKNTTDIKLRRGKLVSGNQAVAVEEMLRVLGDPDDPEIEFLAESEEEIKLSADAAVRAEQLRQLRQIVRSGAPRARLAAVKAIGRARETQNVPLLIYALTDPDPQVAVAADEALRFVGRKLGGFAMKVPPDKAARDEAVAYWKSWFTKNYPDLGLEE